MKTIKLGIDIGSLNTSITREGQGVVLKEPSLCVFKKAGKDSKFVFAGLQAAKYLNSLNDDFKVVQPIENGIIADEDACSKMLNYFVKQVVSEREIGKVEATLSYPCGASAQEQQSVIRACYLAGVGKVSLVPAPVAALNAIKKDTGFVVIMGCQNTEIANVYGGDIIKGYTINYGGKDLQSFFASFLEQDHKLKITPATARVLNFKLTSLIRGDRSNMEIMGTDVATAKARSVIVSAQDLFGCTEYYVNNLVKMIKNVIEETQEQGQENTASVEGIMVCGGGAKILGLSEYLTKKLKLPVYLPETPDNVVVLGL